MPAARDNRGSRILNDKNVDEADCDAMTTSNTAASSLAAANGTATKVTIDEVSEENTTNPVAACFGRSKSNFEYLCGGFCVSTILPMGSLTLFRL